MPDQVTETEGPQINRGLQGVYFERSKVCDIDGKEGNLWYRGYSIHDLATRSTFEETAFLLIYGELPNTTELEVFTTQLKTERKLPDNIYQIIESIKDAHPMDVLRTAVSALSATDPEVTDNTPEANIRKTLRLTSQVPMIVAAQAQMRNDNPIIAPDESLDHAANFLYMMTGEIPDPESAKLMDTDLILHAEHGTNASSFTARVVAGTDANLHASIVAAISALSGPAHGGAAENVMQMAIDIGEPDNAAAYVKNLRKNRQPVMGFGHRVYRAEDPRARHMREGVKQLSEKMGQPKWYQILQSVVDAMSPYSRLGVNVNVDFYAGVVYYLHGIPEDFFVPIFSVGRTPGWCVQVIEQFENNILLRPLTVYTGPEPREYKSITDR